MVEQSLDVSAALLTSGRLLVGSMFLLAGLLKYKAGLHWFWQQILDYQLIKGKPARLLARSLPGLEILCGSMLLIGLFTPFVVVISFMLLGGFIAAVSSTLWRGRAVGCGCFGRRTHSSTQQAQWTITYRNLGLMGLLLLLYRFGPGYVALDAWLWPVSIPNTQLLFWLVLLWGLLVVSIVWLKRTMQKRPVQPTHQPL